MAVRDRSEVLQGEDEAQGRRGQTDARDVSVASLERAAESGVVTRGLSKSEQFALRRCSCQDTFADGNRARVGASCAAGDREAAGELSGATGVEGDARAFDRGRWECTSP